MGDIAVSETGPLIVRVELPTPDIVVIRHRDGELTVLADPSVPEDHVRQVAASNATAMTHGVRL